MKRILLYILLASVTQISWAQCGTENTAFSAGEDLEYELYFNWQFIWIKVGTASMDIQNSNYGGKPGYRCHLISRGSKRADRYFIMRDTLVSYVTRDLTPLYYRKGAFEGKQYKVDEVWYNYGDGQCNLRQKYKNASNDIFWNEYHSRNCVYDMLSMLLRARSFTAEGMSKGHRIKFLMADGDDVKEETLVFRGKKKFKMEDESKTQYNALVFSFIEKDGRKEKEIITFYISDDANHIPLRLDMNLNFGTAKAFLKSANGLRNPQTAIIK